MPIIVSGSIFPYRLRPIREKNNLNIATCPTYANGGNRTWAASTAARALSIAPLPPGRTGFNTVAMLQEQNADYYSQYVTEDIADYIERKRYLGVHGNHLEIQAMSELYNRPIHIYCYSTG